MNTSAIKASTKKRWMLIIGSLAVQGLVAILAYINLFQTARPDISLAPVAGRPDVCRIVQVATFTDAWVNGIQPGMLVRKVDKPFLDRYETGTLTNCQLSSQSLYVEVIDHNIILRLNAALSPRAIPQLILAAVMAIVFSLTGITIYLRALDRPTGRMAYCLFYCTSYIFLLVNAQSQLWINIIFYILGLLTWGMAATFVWLLPRAPRPPKKHRWRVSPYTPLVVSVILVACNLPIILFLPWARFAISLITSIYAGICVLIIGWIMFWGLRHLSQPEKQISRVMVVGIIFFLLALGLSHNAAISSSFVLNSFTHLLPAPLMLLPIVCGYSLIRRQFLGLTSLLSRQVMRGLMWLLLAFFFLVPSTILVHVIQDSVPSQTMKDYCYAGLMLLNLLLFPRAWNAIRNFGDQVFYQDFYEYNRSLRELSAELTRLQRFDQICAFILPRLARL
ncbi:MAG: hypothetical protein J2P36_29330, partial [Ktedonobacteraceae bacterium]|nr:hypothetical protein [Ktedonobacteraceae bacterium]